MCNCNCWCGRSTCSLYHTLGGVFLALLFLFWGQTNASCSKPSSSLSFSKHFSSSYDEGFQSGCTSSKTLLCDLVVCPLLNDSFSFFFGGKDTSSSSSETTLSSSSSSNKSSTSGHPHNESFPLPIPHPLLLPLLNIVLLLLYFSSPPPSLCPQQPWTAPYNKDCCHHYSALPLQMHHCHHSPPFILPQQISILDF